ncbi:hypothetical protein M3Y98_00489700 [Aphelenchoides besseyi]|nr:hypothetical protein M3Y98_00489700 [Aphelenchoides besseyi]KAI6207659.1 hypothetical protein M3Y96_00032400 [Aphelenchoides besseyi]
MKTTQKQATRGQQQIFKENWITIQYYSLAVGISVGLYFLLHLFVFSPISWKAWSGFVVSLLFELVALFLMFKAAKSVRGEKGQVIDAGMDLNDPQAFGEYFKDTIILCVIIQFAALLSTYFLGLLFIFPSFATYKLWVGVIGPWIFAPAPEPDPMDEKRQKRRQKVVYRH